MLYNCLFSAVRHVLKRKLHVLVNIVGLAIAIAMSILVGLFLRNELTFEHFIPQYDRIYRVSTTSIQAFAPQVIESSPPDFAGWLKLDFPGVEYAARLMASSHSLRRNDVEANEQLFWADPDFFRIFPLRAIAGDLSTALDQPDGLVLTQSMARKYFGNTDPIGKTIEIDRQHTMRVTAVLEDLPTNTHLGFDVVATGNAPYSYLRQMDNLSGTQVVKPWLAYTYVRLRKGTDPRVIEDALPQFLDSHLPGRRLTSQNRSGMTVQFLPIARIHLYSHGLGGMKPPGSIALLYAVSLVAALVLIVSGINFANMITAHAASRAVEIAMRKVAGASRFQLMLQFLGEATFYVLLSTVVGLAIVELYLPAFSGLSHRRMVLADWDDVYFFSYLGMGVLLLAVAAGAYPAFVLSAPRPVALLRGRQTGMLSGGRVRQVLVITQFAVLIGFLLVTATIWRQTQYAFAKSLRLPTDQVLLIQASCEKRTFQDQLQLLSGVQGAACSQQLPIAITPTTEVTAIDGRRVTLYYSSVGPGYFELYGLHPVAGRFFAVDRPADAMSLDWPREAQEPIVINETAARNLGFLSPETAIGKSILWTHLIDRKGTFSPPHYALVIGVLPDYPMNSIRTAVEPAAFYFYPPQLGVVSVLLRRGSIPETLRQIDRLWRHMGMLQPLSSSFLDPIMQAKYRDVTDQEQIFAAFSALALLIAGLGLLALCAFVSEVRTREIGIRKAMGADRWDVLSFLMWQFVRPVIWANVIAWPVGAMAMAYWLHGFTYHVDLSVSTFLASAGAALAVALMVVGAQTFKLSAASPVTALHEE